MKAKPTPSQALLLKRLSYDPLTGLLTFKQRDREGFKTLRSWATWNGKFAGKPALNSISVDGYRAGSLDYQSLLAHRVIWKMVYGYDPEQVDHENGVRHDNTLANLRDANNTTNSQNRHLRSDNASGHTGVYKIPDRTAWTVEITYRGVTHYLGSYPSFEQAVSIRQGAEVMYQFHRNHGRTDDRSNYSAA